MIEEFSQGSASYGSGMLLLWLWLQYGRGSIPGPGTSACYGYSQKKKKSLSRFINFEDKYYTYKLESILTTENWLNWFFPIPT